METEEESEGDAAPPKAKKQGVKENMIYFDMKVSNENMRVGCARARVFSLLCPA